MEKRTKYILLGLSIIAVGTGGYFLYKHLKEKNELKSTDDFRQTILDDAIPEISKSTPKAIPSGSKKMISSGFPLKKGSKGNLVKELQLALIQKYGKSILPKFGADSYFGNEVVDALKAKGYNTVVDAKEFAKIVGDEKRNEKAKVTQNSSQYSNDSAISISKYLHKAIANNNIFYALDALRKIKNKTQYALVNEVFKRTKINLVTTTIVTALLNRFNTPDYKKKLNQQFYRIGLKFNGTIWTLSGVKNILFTIENTNIWDESGKAYLVPKSTLLGEYLDAKDNYTKFLTQDNQIFFVTTKSIAYQS